MAGWPIAGHSLDRKFNIGIDTTVFTASFSRATFPTKIKIKTLLFYCLRHRLDIAKVMDREKEEESAMPSRALHELALRRLVCLHFYHIFLSVPSLYLSTYYDDVTLKSSYQSYCYCQFAVCFWSYFSPTTTSFTRFDVKKEEINVLLRIFHKLFGVVQE